MDLNTVFAGKKETHNDLSMDKDVIIALVNEERVSRKLPVLIESKVLDTVAQKKLDNMIEENYFKHTSPSGNGPWKWFFESGYDFAYAGENLATNFTNEKQQHKAWMDSPKHRKNILNKDFTHTGVAVGETKVDGKRVLLTVQVFATPQEHTITPTSFAPNSYETVEELFFVGNPEDKEEIAKVLNSKLNELSISNNIDGNSLKYNPRARQLAWFLIVALVIIIVIVEHKIFYKKS